MLTAPPTFKITKTNFNSSAPSSSSMMFLFTAPCQMLAVQITMKTKSPTTYITSICLSHPFHSNITPSFPLLGDTTENVGAQDFLEFFSGNGADPKSSDGGNDDHSGHLRFSITKLYPIYQTLFPHITPSEK